MADSGHRKNVLNFAEVVAIVTALGGEYKPVQTLILLSVLQTKLSEAQAIITAVNTAESTETGTGNTREAEFEGFGKFATRLGKAISVNINDLLFSDNAATIIRKLQGRRAGDAPVDDPLTPDINESKSAHSVSQQTYDMLTENFASLIELIKTKQDIYKPNEAEFTIAGLEAKLTAMRDANTAAKQAAITADNTRAQRDSILYNPETGVLKLVRLVKDYIAYQPGKESAAYQQLVRLQFRDLSKE
jgi:hypothetical protein